MQVTQQSGKTYDVAQQAMNDGRDYAAEYGMPRILAPASLIKKYAVICADELLLDGAARTEYLSAFPTGWEAQTREMEAALINGERLMQRRLAMGYSQMRLAGSLGVRQATISRWEAGKMPIENPQMLDLALQTIERNPTAS